MKYIINETRKNKSIFYKIGFFNVFFTLPLYNGIKGGFMNIYESIYMIQMNDFYELKTLIQYYRPMVTEIWADIFVRKTYNILCEKEEFYRHADYTLYCCIFEYRFDNHAKFSTYYRRCLKNKAYDILRHNLRKERISISFDQKIREDTQMYYSQVKLIDELNIHDVVMDKLTWEETLVKIEKVFGLVGVQTLLLKKQGYSLKEIAAEIGISVTKVTFILHKIKKWYTTIDS